MERRLTTWKFVRVCQNQMGLVIGKKWCNIIKIRRQTGTFINKTDGGFNISGNEDQIQKAENMIKSIINSCEKNTQKNEFKKESLHLQVPECAVGTIIGKNGDRLNSIMEETDTKIMMIETGQFYIKGDADKQCKARLMIKDAACHAVHNFSDKELPSWCKSFSFIDDKSIDMKADFQLQLKESYKHEPVWTVKNIYKLKKLEENVLSEQALQGCDRYDILKGNVLEVLQRLHEQCDNHVVDIWCLFGNAYITDVNEDEESQVYLLKEVQERLSDKDNPWHSVFYKREIHLEELQRALESTSLRDSYVRCAFSILTPSCRNVRIKVFLKSEENGSLSFYNHCPESMKGVIKSVYSDDGGPSYFLCKPPHKHLRATIFCPFDELDCYLMIRTKMKTAQATSKEEEEENQVIIDFLNKHLVIRNGKLQLLEKVSLPVDFDVHYWRQSKRTMFRYPSKDFNFTIKITEEYSGNEAASEVEEEVECVNDVQLRCNEWDEGFSAGEWRPEEIIQNLPTFLSLVNDVHKNIKFQQSDEI